MGRLPKRTYRKLFLAEWLEVTGRDPADCAKAVGVNRSYIANLIAGRKINVSAHVMVAISEYLGITVNDLYRAPPSAESISAFHELSPTARTAIFDTPKRK